MKKILISLASLLFLICVGVLLYFLIVKTVKNKIAIITKTYNIDTTKTSTLITVPIIINKKNTFLVKKALIEEVVISTDTKAFTLAVNDFSFHKKIKNNYYLFYLDLTIPFSKTNIEMLKTNILITYKNGKTLKFLLGDLYFYYFENPSSLLTPKRLMGIINKVNEKYAVCGFQVQFNLEKKVKLRSVKLFTKNYTIGKMTRLSSFFSADIPVKSVYDNYDEENSFEEAFIMPGEIYFFPLYLKNKNPENVLTICFEFNDDESASFTPIENFRFFSEKNVTINLDDYIFLEVSDDKIG